MIYNTEIKLNLHGAVPATILSVDVLFMRDHEKPFFSGTYLISITYQCHTILTVMAL